MDERRHITITPNGPYLVYGGVPLHRETIEPNAEGGSWSWGVGPDLEAKPTYALCRCGASKSKPFCDGTHKDVDFDGTETASREPFRAQAKKIDGPELDLLDVDPLCAFARFCDNAGGIWELIKTADHDEKETIVLREGTYCPSGRLVLERKDGSTVEPEHSPSIALVEDPAKSSSGPIWVRGGIPITSQDGTPYETRNRVTLCRCGKSANKPFCDGTHVDVAFRDENA